MNFGWTFAAAGTFAGVTQFKDGDEEKRFVRVDTFGGSVSTEVSAADFKRYTSIPLGSDVRIGGDVRFSGGRVRLTLTSLLKQGDKEWADVTTDEALSGLRCGGYGVVMDKSQFDYSDGRHGFRLRVKVHGCVMRFACTSSLYDDCPVGGITLSGDVTQELRYTPDGSRLVSDICLTTSQADKLRRR